MQLCRFSGYIAIMSVVLSATIMLMNLFVAVMQVTVSIAIMQLEVSVSAWFKKVKVSAENECVTIFIKVMHVGVPAAILKVVFSAVHQAHEYFYCNYTGDCFSCSYVYVCHGFK